MNSQLLLEEVIRNSVLSGVDRDILRLWMNSLQVEVVPFKKTGTLYRHSMPFKFTDTSYLYRDKVKIIVRGSKTDRIVKKWTDRVSLTLGVPVELEWEV